MQPLLHRVVKLAQLWQGVGAAGRIGLRVDKAVLRRLQTDNEPPIIFDVGANRGEYLQLAIDQLAGRQTVIHSFEPSAAAFRHLEQRFAGKYDIVLNNLALGSESADLPLYSDAPGSELSSLYQRRVEHHNIKFTHCETVRVDTLDNYCKLRGVTRIDLLKLDVEGHELPVLHGATALFESRAIGMVSFEFGGCNVDSRTYVRDFFDFFSAQHMRLTRVTGFGRFCPIPRYEEALEQFRTTCFVATRG